MKAFVNSETGPLVEVLMGHIEKYRPGKPLNEMQKHFFVHDPPQPSLMLEQYENLACTLADQGVVVRRYDHLPDNLNRPFARDALVVIGTRLLQCVMKNHRPPVLENALTGFSNTIIKAGSGILEGGDLIQDPGTVFVGISQRTEEAAVKWLAQLLGDEAEVVPVFLNPGFLHLDVVFNRIGADMALVYPAAIESESLKELAKRYTLLTVSADEQFTLGVNVLSVNPQTIISEERQSRINALMQSRGIEVIEIPFAEVAKLGGAFRCTTNALFREQPPA